MSDTTGISPFSAAFVFVETATNPGEHSVLPKSGDAHAVRRKLMEQASGEVVFAHPLAGPADLLTLIRGRDSKDLLSVLHKRIRSLSLDSHNYVARTQSHIVTSSFGKPLVRETFENVRLGAWILGTVGVPDPAQDIATYLLKDRRITVVAPVLGQFDIFIFVQADDLRSLTEVIDQKIRTLRHFISTDTRIMFTP